MNGDANAKLDTAWMRQAFVDVQAELQIKVKRAAQSISHAGTQGAVNEDHWIDVFRAYLPNRYQVATGFVIDSLGRRSEQIDIIVFDRHFTPTLLDQKIIVTCPPRLFTQSSNQSLTSTRNILLTQERRRHPCESCIEHLRR